MHECGDKLVIARTQAGKPRSLQYDQAAARQSLLMTSTDLIRCFAYPPM